MIKQVNLTNFQSHKKTELNFSPNVNVIVGSSDNGKSSIIRAINWAVSNRPLGIGNVSRWALDKKNTIVRPHSVTVKQNDSTILRKKVKEENTYEVDGEELKAFGTDVPEEVQDAFNFSNINIQSQLEPPFLLSESAGEISRTLNKIVNIDKIDSSLKKIGSMKRETNNNASSASKALVELNERLETFSFITDVEKEITKLEHEQTLIDFMRDNFEKCEVLTEKIRTLKDKLKAYKTIPKVAKLIEKAIIMKRETEETENYISSLTETLSTITDLTQEMLEIEPMSKLNIDQLIEDKETISKLTDTEKSLGEQLDCIYDTQDELQGVNKKLNELDTKWETVPDVCPLCEGKGKLK